MKPSSSGGGSRANALWGRGGRQGSRGRGPVIGTIVALAATAALALPAAGVSANSPAPGAPGAVSAFTDAFGNHAAPGLSHFGSARGTMVSTSLMQNMQAHPRQVFHVIVTGTGVATNSQLTKAINSLGKSGRQFKSITGVTATITGADLQTLAKKYPKLVQAITPDRVVKTADYQSSQMWATTADVTPLWPVVNRRTGLVALAAPQAPAIAFIDSGVNAADTADFGSRVVATADFCSLCTDGPTGADLEGHGTMVAGIAAGSSPRYPGVAQNAPIVSIRVADANGESMESDVIAACGWIAANASKYGIKVVNISMAGASPTSIQFDPLDKAVEQLWFQGITVVAAAGNYGTGSAVDMSAAPGNDPFIITVGATDQNLTSTPADDTIAPWSAFGYTADGFSKPDISAPGRYLIMPVPMGSTIPTAVPDRVVAPGYMWMSGTSFSGGRGCSGSDPRAASELDAGPGQGRADADGELPPVRGSAGRRRRRSGRSAGGEPADRSAEPERRPRRVRLDRSDDRRSGVQPGGVGQRGLVERGVGLGGVELGSVGECRVVERRLGKRGVELGSVELQRERGDDEPRDLHRGDVRAVGTTC